MRYNDDYAATSQQQAKRLGRSRPEAEECAGGEDVVGRVSAAMLDAPS